MLTSAVTYLFNPSAKGVGGWYGGTFDPAFLDALSAADPDGHTKSMILRGDSLPSILAEKITAISFAENASGYTQSYDMDLYRTVIWDVADSLATQWATVDLNTFPAILAKRDVYCIAVPSLPLALKGKVDEALQGSIGYLGAIEIDLGNPIQRRIFLDCLIDDAFVADGQLVLELSWEGYKECHFEGGDKFQPRGERYVPYGELDALKPEIPCSDLSERGKIAAERYAGKRRFSLQERVAEALVRSSYSKRPKSSTTYSLQTFSLNDNSLEADLPEAKFVRYLLDENHPKGGSKARFFREALGIGPTDWRYLAAQLHDGLISADLVEADIKDWSQGFGITFNAIVPVKGLNGRTISIDTNWIMEPGQIPRLSTAVPAKATDASVRDGIVPPVVSNHLEGDTRWAAVYELAAKAGTEAAIEVVPTPMAIVGGNIEMEGMCGFAWVRIKDGRKGFARWALRSGRANRHYQSGAQIFADVGSQSVDRAKAYATAFAAVLKHNGIECEVTSRLD